MKNKIYDYDKSCFKRITNDKEEYIYYIKVDSDYIEVSKEVYLTCLKSYEKIKYDRKREVANSVKYFENIDQATSFILSLKPPDYITEIYMKDLVRYAIEEIYKLPDKYKDIAICIFLKDMNIYEVSQYLNIPKSTIYDRKIKIQKILKEILKKAG